jgi:hypothetical protein
MTKRIFNELVLMEMAKERYNLPVIGHFRDRSIRFNSIREASDITGISYHLIFEAAIGKIKSAKNTQWEYENGAHWLRYKALYIRQQRSYTRYTGFNDPR